MWVISTSDDRAALVARLALGVVMFPHGAQKALGWFGGEGFRGTIESMRLEGIPVAIVVMIMATELLGSLALVVGVVGRLAAAAIAAIMLGAITLVHAQNGFFMNWTGKQAGEGFEYHLLALALALVVVIRGSGALSVDRALVTAATEPGTPSEGWGHVGLTAPDVDDVPSQGPRVPASR